VTVKGLKYRASIGSVGSLLLTFLRPETLVGRIFWLFILVLLGVQIGTTFLSIPFAICLPLAAFLISHFLKVFLQQPIRGLLQLTRMGGWDLEENYGTKILGRDEFSRVARAIFGMARRMKRSAGEARENNTRIDELLSAIDEGFVLFDENAKVLKVNNTVRRWLGFYGDTQGKDVTDLFRSMELAKIIKDLTQQLSNTNHSSQPEEADPIVIEDHIIEGPETRKVRIKIKPTFSNHQRIFLMFLFDVSSFAKLEQMRADFFANVSHELKTPISAIRGYSELLIDLNWESNLSLGKSFLQIIERNSLELTKLIDQMLTVTGLETGTLTLDLRPFDLAQSAQQVVETLLPKAQLAGVQLELSIKNKNIRFLADKTRFDSVLLNLVDNAIKYNRPHGKVTITCRDTETETLIYVEDTGIGMSELAQLRAFERFYRADKAHTRLGGGTGLGLAIVKHIVLAHGGTISLRSELEVGTVFTLKLPKETTQKRIGVVAPL
jgi:two-component system, OmpR family, phosphate regulon sensor histidine kinase PhoR